MRTGPPRGSSRRPRAEPSSRADLLALRLALRARLRSRTRPGVGRFSTAGRGSVLRGRQPAIRSGAPSEKQRQRSEQRDVEVGRRNERPLAPALQPRRGLPVRGKAGHGKRRQPPRERVGDNTEAAVSSDPCAPLPRGTNPGGLAITRGDRHDVKLPAFGRSAERGGRTAPPPLERQPASQAAGVPRAVLCPHVEADLDLAGSPERGPGLARQPHLNPGGPGRGQPTCAAADGHRLALAAQAKPLGSLGVHREPKRERGGLIAGGADSPLFATALSFCLGTAPLQTGAVASTAKERVAGVWSRLPAASRARTDSV